ncbi:hypothetical protein T484DRAFT_1904779 [Baffinella frigidus]|nr:hypothetical protein T484DRAFT_1904779 [Cryptophyta sp. CCMP2293]
MKRRARTRGEAVAEGTRRARGAGPESEGRREEARALEEETREQRVVEVIHRDPPHPTLMVVDLLPARLPQVRQLRFFAPESPGGELVSDHVQTQMRLSSTGEADPSSLEQPYHRLMFAALLAGLAATRGSNGSSGSNGPNGSNGGALGSSGREPLGSNGSEATLGSSGGATLPRASKRRREAGRGGLGVATEGVEPDEGVLGLAERHFGGLPSKVELVLAVAGETVAEILGSWETEAAPRLLWSAAMVGAWWSAALVDAWSGMVVVWSTWPREGVGDYALCEPPQLVLWCPAPDCFPVIPGGLILGRACAFPF